MEVEAELEGEGEDEEGPGEAWGIERPGCKGGGCGGGADVTNPPIPPVPPLLPLPPAKCSKRPIPGCSCSWARAASAG